MSGSAAISSAISSWPLHLTSRPIDFGAVMTVPHDREELAAALAADLPAGGAVAGLRVRFRKGEGERADLRRDPVEVARPAEILGEDVRVELVLGDQHPLGQAFGRVAGEDRDFDLAENLAAIEVGRDEMDRRAGHWVSGCEAGLVGAEALVLRQEGRMDVDDPPVPAGDELVGQDAHEPGKRDQVDRMVIKGAAARPSKYWLLSFGVGAGIRTTSTPSAAARSSPGAAGLSPVTSTTS